MFRRGAAALVLAVALAPAAAVAKTGDAPLFAIAAGEGGRVTIRLPAAGADGILGR